MDRFRPDFHPDNNLNRHWAEIALPVTPALPRSPPPLKPHHKSQAPLRLCNHHGRPDRGTIDPGVARADLPSADRPAPAGHRPGPLRALPPPPTGVGRAAGGDCREAAAKLWSKSSLNHPHQSVAFRLFRQIWETHDPTSDGSPSSLRMPAATQ